MQLFKTPFGVEVALADGSRLPVRHVIGIGRNYVEHAREQGADVPQRPMLFTKNPFSVGLSGDDIVIPKPCQDRPQVDFEGELGVLIGAGPDGEFALDVSAEGAGRYILGYCVANDVSARWWQKEGGGGQFYRGKSFDTFCPIGPSITPSAAVANSQDLRILTRVNGQVMQDGSTRDMVFSVATLVAEVSRGHTILPGTLILTGTPSGVGFARNPPVFLKDGDTVEVEIPGLGVIRNGVRNG